MEAAEREAVSLAARGRKRKSSKQHHYEEAVKTEIGKHAIKYGNKSAVEKFSKLLGSPVPEPTVRNFKRELEKQVQGAKV